VPAKNAEAERIVVRRKRLGTITLDDLPQDQREGYPAAGFWGVPVSALYWCDGKRNLAEVIRLTTLEMGPQTFDFVGYFRFLERHGYVEFVEAPRCRIVAWRLAQEFAPTALHSQAMMPFTTVPFTSVRRKSRPL